MEPEIKTVFHHSYVESSALKQIQTACQKFTKIDKAVAMPDLHPGPGYPIGCAFRSHYECYPELIGGDIGCGMTLMEIPNKKSHKLKLPKLASKLDSLDLRQPHPDATELLEANGIPPTGDYDRDLGSIGGGNHFAEFLEIEEIKQHETFQQLNLNNGAESTLLLIHSGSRTFGQYVAKQTESTPILTDPTNIANYLEQHDHAVNWGKANRMMIAHRIADHLNLQAPQPVLNIIHNYLQHDPNDPNTYIHRKGVGFVNPGEISVIPGSRGSFSYLVQMTSNQELANDHLNSIAHGAGRRWNRSSAEKHMQAKYRNPRELHRTKLDSIVVCDSKPLLYQEAPEAYKPVDDVIQDLVEHKLVTVVAILRPLLTYKS